MARTVISPELGEYLKKVDAALAEAAGVRYSDVFKDLHGDISRASDAFREATAPEVFASQVIFGDRLVRVADVGPDAGEINKRRAALIEFVRESDDWSRGFDGLIYMQNDEGDLIRMAPTKGMTKSEFGFKIEVARATRAVPVDGYEDGMSPVIPEEGADFEQIGSGLDIKDVMAKFEQRYTPSQGMGFR